MPVLKGRTQTNKSNEFNYGSSRRRRGDWFDRSSNGRRVGTGSEHPYLVRNLWRPLGSCNRVPRSTQERRQARLKTWTVLAAFAIAIAAGTVLFNTKTAQAATLYSQTTHDFEAANPHNWKVSSSYVEEAITFGGSPTSIKVWGGDWNGLGGNGNMMTGGTACWKIYISSSAGGTASWSSNQVCSGSLSPGYNQEITFTVDVGSSYTTGTHYVRWERVSGSGDTAVVGLQTGGSNAPGRMYMVIDGSTPPSNQVEFQYPEPSSTIGVKWRYEWTYQTTTTVPVIFKINTCPYLTSCANTQTVPSSFVSTTTPQTGTHLVIAPFTPGQKTATITMYEAASGASLDTDVVTFTVSNTASSNTSSTGPFSTSTVDTSPVHCEINLPDVLFGDDSSVDPCALTWWLFVPSGDLIGDYVGEMRTAFDNTEPYHTVVSVFGTIADTSIATTTRPTLTIPNMFATSTSTPAIAIITTSTWDFTEGMNWQNIRSVATVALIVGWVLGLLGLLLALFKSE